MSLDRKYDAIIIGCGPAGACAAAVLAAHGRSVVVLEREKFPRYHIGESLIPYTYFPLRRMGLIEKMKESHFTKKYSVQFVGPDGRASHPFYFFKHLKHDAANTWQVLRSEFDQLLMDNARAKGAEVIEEVAVRETIEENGYVVGVRAMNKAGEPIEFHAPMTLDATGRDALSMSRNGWKVRDPYLDKIAIWTYYKGAMRDPGVDEGATTIAYVPEKGWFWYIPLAGDVVSVGIVAEKAYLYNGSKAPAEIFHREVSNNVWVQRHLAIGEQFGPYRVTGEYSYRSRFCAANGLILIGDAFAFLDPVFSSGVFIALCSGERAADAAHRALTDGDYSAARFASYGADMCRGIEAMRRLVYAFYDRAFSFRTFVGTYPHLTGDLTDCLIGNLFIDFDPLFNAVAEFARVPAPLAHGLPLVAAP
jgi:flavin-dependent dehydrogenase